MAKVGKMFLMLTWSEIESKAVAFQKRWKKNSGDEKQSGQTFEKDFMDVFGVEWRDGLHEHPVYLKDGTTGYIDYFIPGKILIEMKSKGQSLAKAYTQAMSYVHALKPEEIPVLVMCCDFDKIEVFNLRKDHPYKPFKVSQLKQHVRIFGLLAGYGLTDDEKTEIEVNTDASYKMAKLHDALKDKGYEGHSLELYLVRLLFCLFAEDTGVFEKESFEKFVEESNPDGSDLSGRLMSLFSILDTHRDKRPKGLPDYLMVFRYINGSIFKDPLPLASFDSKMRGLLLECSKDFNWSKISPAIFGAMFQGVMDQEERRSLGAHYTSRENIMKVIQPLFLDELYDEFERNKTTRKELLAFQNKLASLHFLDPACGSGNFLIVAYEELRKLEFEVIKLIFDYGTNPTMEFLVQVKPEQFNGIEIEDFPAQIANLSMILMKHLMDQEISNYFGFNAVDFPIQDTPHIVQGNALTIDWDEVIPADKLNYIMGNPPFIGYAYQTRVQAEELKNLYRDEQEKIMKTSGLNDYVSAWFYKASELMQNTKIRTAFVSTNSICQGEQVYSIWAILFAKFKIHIDFAYRTFKWANEARSNAAVHVVIVGFSSNYAGIKKLWDEEGLVREVNSVNAYLVNAPNLFIKSRSKPLSALPGMVYGNKPAEGGFLIFDEEEKNQMLLERTPQEFIRPFLGAREFLHNTPRYCLWLYGVAPNKYMHIKTIRERIEKVKAFRLSSTKAKTIADADKSMLFQEVRQPKDEYIIVPRHSSENRRYIPIGYVSNDVICGDSNLMIPNATISEFAIITSNVHMSWMRTVAGRIKSDFRYSASIVYNTFPIPLLTDVPKAKLEMTGSEILQARKLYSEMNLSDLYDPTFMPPELRKAHQANDKAVWEAYGKAWDITSEEDCVAHLMKLYAEMTEV